MEGSVEMKRPASALDSVKYSLASSVLRVMYQARGACLRP